MLQTVNLEKDKPRLRDWGWLHRRKDFTNRRKCKGKYRKEESGRVLGEKGPAAGEM